MSCRRVWAALVATMLPLAGCNAGSALGPSANPQATSGPSPLVAPTAPEATTTTAIEATPQPSPDQAAAALLDAWRRGDRATALRVASVDAVAVLFSSPSTSTVARGCQVPIAQQSDCAFGIGGGRLLALHAVRGGTGWVIGSVDFG
jgi:hypothetical protein